MDMDGILRGTIKVRAFERTKNTVISKFNNGGGADGIKMDALKVSLLDPVSLWQHSTDNLRSKIHHFQLSRTRIDTPIKAEACAHLQCFDLNNYLAMNAKKGDWKCPICGCSATYEKLLIDEYYIHCF